MPGRNANSESYRYGFQNQEVDNEIKGTGNSANFKYRMHDPRLGRFFAADPLARKYPHNGPYNFSENIVINGRELEGLEVTYKTGPNNDQIPLPVFKIETNFGIGKKFDSYLDYLLTSYFSSEDNVESWLRSSFGTENVQKFGMYLTSKYGEAKDLPKADKILGSGNIDEIMKLFKNLSTIQKEKSSPSTNLLEVASRIIQSEEIGDKIRSEYDDSGGGAASIDSKDGGATGYDPSVYGKKLGTGVSDDGDPVAIHTKNDSVYQYKANEGNGSFNKLVSVKPIKK